MSGICVVQMLWMSVILYVVCARQGSTLTVDRLPGATHFHVGHVKSTWQGNRHTLPHHLVNAGKSDKLTHIHYNDKLDESPDLFTTSFASGDDP